MTDIEKKIVELCFIERQIAELYRRKNELKNELESFTRELQRLCGQTGKTMDQIDTATLYKKEAKP